MSFSEDQPRDEHGRWTSGGSGSDDAIRAAASDSVNNLMYKAKLAAPEVENLAGELASELGGSFVPINFKSKESITRKANDEYGGDASRVKDAVRTTIVVEHSQLASAAERLRSDGRLTVKVQDGPEYYGYKGVLANMKTKTGIHAEIQANSPGMIFAKEPKHIALNYMSEAKYNEIAKRTGLEGGRGHELYEKIRKMPKQNMTRSEQIERDNLIEESKKYYSNFYGF